MTINPEQQAAAARQLIRSFAWSRRRDIIPSGATPCIQCDGTGLIETAFIPWEERITDCDVCHGDGYLTTD